MFAFTQFSEDGRGMVGVTISVAFFVAVAMLAIAVLFKEKNLNMPKSTDSFKMADIKLVFKNGTV